MSSRHPVDWNVMGICSLKQVHRLKCWNDRLAKCSCCVNVRRPHSSKRQGWWPNGPKKRIWILRLDGTPSKTWRILSITPRAKPKHTSETSLHSLSWIGWLLLWVMVKLPRNHIKKIKDFCEKHRSLFRPVCQFLDSNLFKVWFSECTFILTMFFSECAFEGKTNMMLGWRNIGLRQGPKDFFGLQQWSVLLRRPPRKVRLRKWSWERRQMIGICRIKVKMMLKL